MKTEIRNKGIQGKRKSILNSYRFHIEFIYTAYSPHIAFIYLSYRNLIKTQFLWSEDFKYFKL